MKKLTLSLMAIGMLFSACNQKKDTPKEEAVNEGAAVYMVEEISPESLIQVFDAMGVKPEGRVAVKISTGEAGGHNYLKPELIGDFLSHVSGHLVECNTAYHGARVKTEDHIKVIEDHGFNSIGGVDIMDAEGDIRIPVRDTTFMKYNIVGSHIENYDFLINLAHFKGHQMGGFGGVLKNQSIGVASSTGKLNIHTAGAYQDVAQMDEAWEYVATQLPQDHFLECMATAATAVSDYFKGKVLYINIMNNMSIDCDCNGNPKEPELADMGILASTDPVALDQACLDLVYQHQNKENDDATSLINRIEKQHGVHTIEHAEKLGFGSRTYHIVKLQTK